MKHQVTTRRAFFGTLVRGTGISSLAALSAYLIARNLDPDCINLGMCSGCKAFPACELPPAQKKKENGRPAPQHRH